MMSKMILLVVGVLGIAGLGSAQLVQVGQCGTINYMDNFLLASFIGTNGVWFELGKTANQVDDCSRLEFGTGTGTVSLSNPSVVNNFPQTATGTATHTTGTSTLTLTLTSSNNPIQFNILASDYTSYAIGMNCANLGDNQRTINLWLLGRAANSLDTAATLTAVNNALSAIGVTVNQLTTVDHSTNACTVLPVIAPGQPVILSGQCSTTTPVIQNFQVGQFTGTWYEISSYDSENAVGTCSRADYTLVGSTVNVVNSQVLNGRLDTISGTATLIGTNQEGRLNVVLNVNGVPVTQELLILDTDYNGYAVSYTCVNLENNQRRVNSWVLSRTQTISAASQTEVTRVINSLLDLNTAYYQTTDQSDTGCFYYPIFTPGVPVVFPGQCDESIPVQANFDATLYTGLWHDIESYPSTFQQGTCNNAFYTLTQQGTVDVLNTQVVNQQLDTMRGVAVIPDPTQPAKLVVTFPIAGTDQTTSTDYWVLATDYNTYSLVYTCINTGNNQRTVFSWKLGRSKAAFSAAANTAMNNVINTINVLDSQYFANRDQSAAGCFYFPEPAVGRPVIFPGQCDQTVAAFPSFNLNQFAGTWHEVQTYPKEQQSGTCVNHDFTTTTTANTLNLVSNQVISQSLSSSSGNVVVETADGSGRLRLSMTVNGVAINFPYWVLATDYTSYALVYSCMDRQDDTRAVYSWKLSRTQTLPEAANTPINTAIAAVQVLDNQYFEAVDQSATGCFYYPIFQPGVPVVFPGQCDQSIPVQTNFDPTQYTGLWHDIESYPSTFQQGTCNNAFYTLTEEGTVDVFNTQVVNQQLDTMRGVAVIPDPTQPAKLRVSFPIAGTDLTTTTDYWVLATDYNTYSLVYTCINTGNNQRTVFSWKLGRSKAAFSAAANTAMNNVINTINVLDSQYFANRDQSAAGCFYFPEPAAGTPVIFPGQCDETVAALPNFNMALFTGTWHEVQTYPKEQQTGSCVNHAFSTGTTANTLNLVSNQVINQIANSASGNVAFESTDASGRLRLTMTVNGMTINFPYWVLATDYTTYALVYSCMNRQDDTRAVYSWKLSRTQTLPDAANTPINAAIAAVQVLNNQYYENVDQSAAGCLSFPDIPAGEPIVIPGQCGTVVPVANFQSTLFAGNWYEAARYASERQTGNCAAKQFTSTQTGFTLSQTIVYNERLTVVSGSVTLPTDGSGVLTAVLTDGTISYTTTIYVLDTDYSDFALLYSCENVAGSNSRQLYSWKLSRSQAGLSQAANDRIAQVIANTDGLLENYYQSTGQTSNDCFYYPVFTETPESIVLPGACPAITAKPNFEPARYLGNWFDVASYPIESQSGTCSRAEYTLIDGVITIRNTMVVGEQLRVQNGIARLSSAGTGLLTVTFILENGEEVVTTYYVLETDYTSFSLVYNCRDLADGSRQVFSWKLSRTPELTAQANTIINNIVSNTQGLLEEYYLQTSQTDADCFYIPEPVPGQSVLFRGSCVVPTLMQNFNVNQYLGWWHEIERYPSEDVAGECTSTNLVQGATAIQVVDSSVYDGSVNETTGTASITTTGIITITRNNIQSILYVLATDYTSYSLVYSCDTITTDWGPYRRVWSAKHSKTRSLTAAGNTAINAVIATNPLLVQEIYDSVNQSDAACFHYRDDASEQVILPGQCDTQIPVQAGFDVSRFAGTWYQIERYPYPQVSNEGTCVGTRYTQNNDGLNVLNWEVLGGTLNTIEGSATVDAATATLNVNLPQEGDAENRNMALRVLLTDYDNYALLYTCVNINAFQRSVGAFKLSRGRSLSNDAQYAIETYMAPREEFHLPYFISIPHDNQCLEPSSALLVKSSIIVMLVCFALQLVM